MPAGSPPTNQRLSRHDGDKTPERRAVTYVVVFLLTYAVARIGELVPQLGTVPVVKVLLVIGVLLVLTGLHSDRRVELRSSRLAITVVWFFALAVFSVAFSVFRAQSLAFVIGPLIAVAGVSWLVFSTASLNGGINAVRYFGALAWCGVVLSAAIIVGGGTGITGRAELQDSSYDSNDLAFVVVGVLPLMLARTQRGSMVWRLFWLASSAAAVWVVLLTQSRGGLLALISVTVALTWSGVRPAMAPQAPGSRSSGGRFSRIASLLILATIAFIAIPPATRERLSTITSVTSDYNVTEARGGRVAIWGRGLSALLERPWGVGVAAFEAAEGMQGGQYRAAHNMYVEVLTELGIVGGVLFIRLWWLAWASASALSARFTSSPGSSPNRELVMDVYMVRPCMIGLLVGGFFLSQGYSILVFSIIAILAGINADVRPPGVGHVVPRMNRSRKRLDHEPDR